MNNVRSKKVPVYQSYEDAKNNGEVVGWVRENKNLDELHRNELYYQQPGHHLGFTVLQHTDKPDLYGHYVLIYTSDNLYKTEQNHLKNEKRFAVVVPDEEVLATIVYTGNDSKRMLSSHRRLQVLRKQFTDSLPVKKTDVSELKVLHAKGYSDTELADALGVTSGSVRWWRKKLSLPRNAKYKSLKFCALVAEGKMNKEIAKELNISTSTVSNWRKKFGLRQQKKCMSKYNIKK